MPWDPPSGSTIPAHHMSPLLPCMLPTVTGGGVPMGILSWLLGLLLLLVPMASGLTPAPTTPTPGLLPLLYCIYLYIHIFIQILTGWWKQLWIKIWKKYKAMCINAQSHSCRKQHNCMQKQSWNCPPGWLEQGQHDTGWLGPHTKIY